VVVLPEPVGAGAQHHAEGRAHELAERLVGVLGHAEVAELVQRPALVEDAEHDLLAPDDAGRRDADVDRAAVDVHGDLAVLRPPPLHDVHARHDLEAADQCRAHGVGQGEHVVQGAVDAEADAQPAVLRLDVDVGRPPPLPHHPHRLSFPPQRWGDDLLTPEMTGVVPDRGHCVGALCWLV
jgi:hypothetical protein